jgi:hypothetical protein
VEDQPPVRRSRIAVHFKPNAQILIGLEPVPARVYSRRWEAGGFQGRAAD